MNYIFRGTNKYTPLKSETFYSPGRYTVYLDLDQPDAFSLVVSMINEHGQYFEDIVSVSISTRFYVWLKYMVLAPVLLLSIPLLTMSSVKKII